MKRNIFLLLTVFFSLSMQAQGLRHSVCVVYPEYTEAEKQQLADYSLHAARMGMRSLSRILSAYKADNIFGSGVVIEHQGRKLVLTNRHVTGYAQTANILFQLNKQNIRYEHCPILSHSADNDLAVIELPQSCDQIPLPLYSAPVEEGLDISAAGFPGLGDKPSWQLTRGIISNAQLDMTDLNGYGRAIQHTASIDPGSSGGPLLVKVEGKYQIAGINTWKASYREGVGIAVPTEDVEAFLVTTNNPVKDNQQALGKLKDISGEQWAFILKNLPDSLQSQIRGMEWNMPLEPIDKTVELAKSLGKNTKGKKKSLPDNLNMDKPHIDKDLDTRSAVMLGYDNFFGPNQRIRLGYEYAWHGYFITGAGFAVPLLKCVIQDMWSPTGISYKTTPGIMGEINLGGQVPIALKQLTLIPRLTQSVGLGSIIAAQSSIQMALAADTRIGLNIQIPVSSMAFVVGAFYDFNVLWTAAALDKSPYKTGDSNKSTYLQNGISINVGLAF